MSQYRDDLPWFPLYASNILSDKRYRLMSPLERFGSPSYWSAGPTDRFLLTLSTLLNTLDAQLRM
jgi:hypothetical protein